VIEGAMEDLDEEQKKLVQDNLDAYLKLCLDFFSASSGMEWYGRTTCRLLPSQ